MALTRTRLTATPLAVVALAVVSLKARGSRPVRSARPGQVAADALADALRRERAAAVAARDTDDWDAFFADDDEPDAPEYGALFAERERPDVQQRGEMLHAPRAAMLDEHDAQEWLTDVALSGRVYRRHPSQTLRDEYSKLER